jgi:hypothetical protein
LCFGHEKEQLDFPNGNKVAASGTCVPEKHPPPIPKIVKGACLLMVYGDPDDKDDLSPVNFFDAAKSVGMRPATLRRYLAKPQATFRRAEGSACAD